MSYEHCERHDVDATNGCEACAAETPDMDPLLTLRALNLLRLVELSRARAHEDAVATQHEHACVDLVTTNDLEGIAGYLLFKPPSW